MKYAQFFARTVLVRNEDVERAFRILNKTLRNERVLELAREQEYFEPPCQKRKRLCHERCVRIYGSEMTRKINMLMRKNRRDPWPR